MQTTTLKTTTIVTVTYRGVIHTGTLVGKEIKGTTLPADLLTTIVKMIGKKKTSGGGTYIQKGTRFAGLDNRYSWEAVTKAE